MNIKVTFKSGEVVKVTDFLVCMFLMECTTPLETMAVIHASQRNNSLALIIGAAQMKGIISCFDEMKVKKACNEKENFIVKVESTSNSVLIDANFVMRLLAQRATPFETLAFIRATQEDPFMNKFMFLGESIGKIPNFQETKSVQKNKNDEEMVEELIHRFGFAGLLD